MPQYKFTDGDVLVKLMEHLNYENTELGVTPHYISSYHLTQEEAENKPNSPLMNWESACKDCYGYLLWKN